MFQSLAFRLGGGDPTIILPSSAVEGDSVDLVATSASGPVLFYDGATLINTDNAAPWTFTVVAVTPGAHPYKAMVGATSSGIKTLNVTAIAPTLVAPVTGGATYGADVALDATTFDDAETTGVTFSIRLAAVEEDTVVGVLAAGHWTGTLDPTGLADGLYDVVAIRHTAAADVESTAATLRVVMNGLVAWIDMQDATAFTEVANVITSVTNKVSATVWNTGTLPAYDATGLNGFKCMTGNGTTQQILSTEAAVVAGGVNANPRTVVMVGSYAVADATGSMFAWGNSGFANSRTVTYGQTITGTGRYTSATSNDAAGSIINTGSTNGIIDTGANAVCWRFSGTAQTCAENNVNVALLDAACAPGTLTPNRFAIFCRPDSVPDNFCAGKLGELLIYTRELTTAEATAIDNLLAAKWGT